MSSRPALEAAAELREAHPSLPHTWYRGLVPLVEAMSTNIVILDAAERALEDRLSQVSRTLCVLSDIVASERLLRPGLVGRRRAGR